MERKCYRVKMMIPFSGDEKFLHETHSSAEGHQSITRFVQGKNDVATRVFDALAMLPAGTALMKLDLGTSGSEVPKNAIYEIDLSANINEGMLHKINTLYSRMKRLETQLLVGDVDIHADVYSVKTNDDGVTIELDAEFSTPADKLKLIGYLRELKGFLPTISGDCEVLLHDNEEDVNFDRIEEKVSL